MNAYTYVIIKVAVSALTTCCCNKMHYNIEPEAVVLSSEDSILNDI